MSTHVIIVETGYKTTSANYKISVSDPLTQETAEQRYAALRAGTDPALPAESGALIVDVGPGQFLRTRRVRGATVLDRVTMGPAGIQ